MQARVNPLEGYAVLITRPAGQGEGLAQLVKQRGGSPVIYPVFNIEPQTQGPEMRAAVSALDKFDLVIFVSAHAVHAVMAVLTELGRFFPPAAEVAAIGPATANCLEGYGVHPGYIPKDTINSEGMLKSLSAFAAGGTKVVLFRGQNGRELLATGLADQGAEVLQIESYRRSLNDTAVSPRLKQWQLQGKPLLSLTSVAIMQGLLEKADTEETKLILQSPLAVLSQRIAVSCRARGFKGVLQVADRPDDYAMVDALIKCTDDRTG